MYLGMGILDRKIKTLNTYPRLDNTRYSSAPFRKKNWVELKDTENKYILVL